MKEQKRRSPFANTCISSGDIYSLSRKTVNTKENLWNVCFGTNQMRDKTAKDNRQTAALISHDLTRNNELAFSSTKSFNFTVFERRKIFFFDFGFGGIDVNDILRKSDVKSRRQDQSMRHS